MPKYFCLEAFYLPAAVMISAVYVQFHLWKILWLEKT